MRQSAKLLPEAGSSGARALGLTILAFMLGTTAVSILGAVLVLTLFRYEFAVGGSDANAYRFDRWNGDVTICLPQPQNPLRMSCSGQPSDWMNVPPKK